jgi:hypothetical protein
MIVRANFFHTSCRESYMSSSCYIYWTICRLFLLLYCSSIYGCGVGDSTTLPAYKPSLIPMEPLTLGVWLPAGLDEYHFAAADQQRLLDLELNYIEWLQPGRQGEMTVEEIAMEFCNRTGLQMPVYYSAPSYTPYDKLHNWATQTEVGEDFKERVRERVLGLKQHWGEARGFNGFLVGHEDYKDAFYPALRQTIEVLRQEDPQRPAITVGGIDSYTAVDRFLDAFFVAGGTPNIFQHEDYVFRDFVPSSGKKLQRQLGSLVKGYDRMARHLQGRHGRWHAIVQVHSERREGRTLNSTYYRKPTPGEISVQIGLALTRGANGIIYFLYSSGIEDLLDKDGQLKERRIYEGLVDPQENPTENYFAVQKLNGLLKPVSDVLEGLYFHGGFSASRIQENLLIRRAAKDLEFGLFGDGVEPQVLLVVNRRPTEARRVELALYGTQVVDALTDEQLEVIEGTVEIRLEPGGWRLLSVGSG